MKNFIGKLTACVAGIEIAIQHTSVLAKSCEHLDPWSEFGQEHGIKVNGLKSIDVASMSAKLNIVCLYSGFDGFVRSARQEWFALSRSQWDSRGPDTPFDEFERNSPNKGSAYRELLPMPLELLTEHYRKIRNATVHPGEETEQPCDLHFRQNKDALRLCGDSYGFTGAPHSIDKIDFHDMKLLARLLLDVGKRVSILFDPGDPAIAESVPKRWLQQTQGALERRRNRVHGLLRTKYGLCQERADNIISMLSMAP